MYINIHNKFEIGEKVKLVYSDKPSYITGYETHCLISKGEDGKLHEVYEVKYRLSNDPYMRKEIEIERFEVRPDDEDMVNKIIIDSLLLSGKEKGNYDVVKRFVDGIWK